MVSVSICDVCRDPSRPVKTYTVTHGDRTRDTDRCDEHGRILEAILTGHDEVEDTRAMHTARRPGPRRKVVTMEEIEQLKQR
jgi:hypothetical protein